MVNFLLNFILKILNIEFYFIKKIKFIFSIKLQLIKFFVHKKINFKNKILNYKILKFKL